MNFALLSAVLRSDLPCPQRMIMTILLNHANSDDKAWPCQATIAEQAGLSVRSVREHLAALSSAGWLTAQATGRGHLFAIARPAQFADQIGTVCRSDRRNLPISEEPDRHSLPIRPAESVTRPAESADQTGTVCRQTTQEPPKNHPRTKTGEAEPPPQVKVPPKPKPGWQEWNRSKADAANAVEIPDDTPAEFRKSWQRWRDYRTGKAVGARVASEAVEWTTTAASSGLRECERAAKIHGWPAVIARMDQAMQGWRGFHFDKLTPPRHNGFTGNRPRSRTDDLNE